MSPPPLPSARGLWRNPISLLGLSAAILSTAFGLPLMVIDIFNRQTNPYLGSLIYLILPVSAAGGIAVTLFGMAWEARRRRRTGRTPQPLPTLDLNKPAHQAMVLAALAGVAVLVVLLSVTGYRAYHFTESVEFCGITCHQVMKPEYTAYQHSPHARVACTQCHVGPGADWYVRSKLSGLYQVYSVAAKKYPRPIPTPVENLRPAPETCEQCHWPEKFFGAQQKTITHYLADEFNSPWQIQLLMKIGGGDPKTGAPAGIHWHMNIKNEIEYVAADERREVIPWVRATDDEGRVTEYLSTESTLTPEEIARATARRMDCVDCHNRPSHIYHPPDQALEQAFLAGRMDRRLPYLKQEGIRLLSASYATEDEALAAIRRGLSEYYQSQHPRLFEEQAVAIEQATEELQRIFAANIFPEMKADWRAHPNHAGHLNSDGCFRCHDGLHRSAEGRVITKDCNACHTILAQGPPEALVGKALTEQPFQHPVDVGVDVTEFKCSQCHTGTSGL
jgi:hypothetical protein